MNTVAYSGQAARLMERSLCVDMLHPLDFVRGEGIDWAEKNPDAFPQASLDDLKRSGIDVIHPAYGINGPGAHLDVMRFVAGANGFIARRSDDFMRIDRVADFERAQALGKVGIIIGVQNSDHFRTPDDVDVFFEAGQRISQLTYNVQNLIGCGATERHDGGISDFGAEIIRRMNRIGMAIDVSHCGDRTTLEACEISKKPVLITHSNCRALVPRQPRCKTDRALKRVAATGGVIGISTVRNFVRDREPTEIAHVIEHIDHLAELVGVEHLAIGTDSDLHGYDALSAGRHKKLKASYKRSIAFRRKLDIEGLNHPQKFYDLTDALLRRGYSDTDVEGILGGNCVRVLSQIWKG